VKPTRQQRQRMKTENKKRPTRLKPVPAKDWPQEIASFSNKRFAVWLSNKYLVQLFEESAAVRLSVNRVSMSVMGRWEEDITWEELQDIKRQVGYGDNFAVEIYPRDKDIVNVANMRHLWVLPEPLPIGWSGWNGKRTAWTGD